MLATLGYLISENRRHLSPELLATLRIMTAHSQNILLWSTTLYFFYSISEKFDKTDKILVYHVSSLDCSSGIYLLGNWKDSQPESMSNRKLRSASHPFFSGTKVDKPSGPSVSIKPYKNPRKPLPRISIKMPLQSKLKRSSNLHSTIEHLKEKQSIIVIDNQLIQSPRTEIAASLDDKTSSEHTLPDIINGNESVMSIQSASSKLPHKNQQSPAGQIGDQALGPTDIDTGFDEDDVADHVQSEPFMEKAISPSKTLANRPELVLQSESVNERSTSLVYHEHSLPEQSLQDVPAGQSKEADVNPRTQLSQLLTTPITVSRPSNTLYQLSQSKYHQSAFLPPTRAAHHNPRLQETNEDSSTDVTHNHQRPRSQGFINNTSSTPTPYYITNLMNPSAQLLHSSVKKKSSSVTENPVAKRICHENITRNSLTRQEPSYSTARLHLFHNSIVKQAPRVAQKPPEKASQKSIINARSDFGTNGIDLSVSRQSMSISAAQNLSSLAQHSHSLVEQSHFQHYLLQQKYYLEQIESLNNKFEQPYIRHSSDKHAHLPGTMNGEFTWQSKPDSIGQINQLLPQHFSQYSPLSRGNKQEMLKHKTSMELIGGAHTNSPAITQYVERNFQFPAHSLSNPVHPHFENQMQRQDLPQYQDLSCHFPETIVNSQRTERQGTCKRTHSPALPKTPSQPLLNAQRGYLLQDPRIRVKLNQNPPERQILDLVSPVTVVDEVEPIMVNAEVQTAPLPDRLDETPSALPPGIGIAYQNPRTKKLVIDQATEMDPVMDADHCEDEAAKLSDKSAPQVEDRGYQADGYLVEEQGSPYQETDSESEISTHVDEYENHARVDTVTENKLTSPQNLQMQQRLVAEQEMLNTYGTLFAQIGANFHTTRDMFNNLRSSIIKCAEIYESLLEKVEKFNEIEQLQISTSLSNNEASGTCERNISESNNAENITDVSSAPKINHPQKKTFILPPEYDPNDPKWTRKHKIKKPGLVELIPRSNVYVSKKELKNCKRESKDCRMLTRMLLTEVFSKNALSVCSLTGGKAKAFNSLNLDVRPGLDGDARMVLLTFVERYGAKRGWKTDDTSGIIKLLLDYYWIQSPK